MPDLDFAVEGCEATPYCAVPTLGFRLAVSNAGSEPILGVALEAQVRIEAQRRRYRPEERARLTDLFGEPARWGQTLRSLLWTHAGVNVPPFEDRVAVDLPVACSYDFNVQVTRYLDALTEQAPIPLTFLFTGSIFFRDEGGPLQVSRISWAKEAGFTLPVATWRRLMDLYYPNTAWLCLRKDVFDRLAAYRTRQCLPTWEQALESLLRGSEAAAPGPGPTAPGAGGAAAG